MIKLYWCGGDSKSNNFGDEIAYYIIHKLSGKKVIFSKPTIKGQIKSTVISILNFNKNTIDTLLAWLNRHNSILFCVGSIIEVSNNNCIVWGSGYIRKEHRAKGGVFLAVRGKLTANRLEEQGFVKPEILGDPALLLPLIYKNLKSKIIIKNNQKSIGIVPHFTEYEYFRNTYGNLFTVIDIRTNNIENIIDSIVSCNYILSTSLHGLIVAHAYQTPAIWIEKRIFEPDGFKFKDYFSSVDIEEYNGFTQIEAILQSEKTVVEFFKINYKLSMINNSISQIQKELLSVAPFKLTNYFEELFLEL